MSTQLIIFTDLDGTLLDSRYTFEKALPAINLIKEENIPLVLCSSKTRAEIEHIRKKLGNNHPFISENGGGIFIPKGYFSVPIPIFRFRSAEEGDYVCIKLGASYDDLRKALAQLRSEGFNVRGFGDMNLRELMAITGLKTNDAKMARQRDFDEPFIFSGNETSERRLKRRIRAGGFNYTQGEFFHITGKSDKGRAVEILKRIYEKQYGKIKTAALGDSPNDIEMLKNVDYPVAVQKKDGSCDRRIRVRHLNRAEGIGPEGWNMAVIDLLKLFA